MEIFNTEYFSSQTTAIKFEFQGFSNMYASIFPSIIVPILWFGYLCYMITESLFINLLVNMLKIPQAGI